MGHSTSLDHVATANSTDGTLANDANVLYLQLQGLLNTLYYLVMVPVALPGNVLTVVVVGYILRHRSSRRRSIPDLCVGFQACVDLCSLLSIHSLTLVAMVMDKWPYPHQVCIFQAFASNTYLKVQFLVHVCISTDRYLAVVHPLQYHRYSSLRITKCALATTVLLSASTTLLAVLTSPDQVIRLHSWHICLFDWSWEGWGNGVVVVINCIVYLFGLTAFIFCNISLVRILWHYHKRNADSLLKEITHAMGAMNRGEKSSQSGGLNKNAAGDRRGRRGGKKLCARCGMRRKVWNGDGCDRDNGSYHEKSNIKLNEKCPERRGTRRGGAELCKAAAVQSTQSLASSKMSANSSPLKQQRTAERPCDQNNSRGELMVTMNGVSIDDQEGRCAPDIVNSNQCHLHAEVGLQRSFSPLTGDGLTNEPLTPHDAVDQNTDKNTFFAEDDENILCDGDVFPTTQQSTPCGQPVSPDSLVVAPAIHDHVGRNNNFKRSRYAHNSESDAAAIDDIKCFKTAIAHVPPYLKSISLIEPTARQAAVNDPMTKTQSLETYKTSKVRIQIEPICTCPCHDSNNPLGTCSHLCSAVSINTNSTDVCKQNPQYSSQESSVFSRAQRARRQRLSKKTNVDINLPFDTPSQMTLLQQNLSKFFRKVHRRVKKQKREILLSRLVLFCAVVFVATWIPYWSVLCLRVAGTRVSHMVENVALKLVFIHALLNPIFYGLCRKNYRKGYRYTSRLILHYLLCGLVNSPTEDKVFFESRQRRVKRYLEGAQLQKRRKRSMQALNILQQTFQAGPTTPVLPGDKSREFQPSVKLQALFEQCMVESDSDSEASSSVDYEALVNDDGELINDLKEVWSMYMNAGDFTGTEGGFLQSDLNSDDAIEIDFNYDEMIDDSEGRDDVAFLDVARDNMALSASRVDRTDMEMSPVRPRLALSTPDFRSDFQAKSPHN